MEDIQERSLLVLNASMMDEPSLAVLKNPDVNMVYFNIDPKTTIIQGIPVSELLLEYRRSQNRSGVIQ